LCLVLIALAFVLNEMSEKLGCLEWWWLGVFIAPTTKPTIGEAICRWAPDSPMRHRTLSGAPVTSPTIRVLTVSTVGALTSCRTGQSGAAPDSYCSVSGAPLTPALTSACTVHAFADDRCAVSRCSAWCTGQSGDSPDSPVNYSGAAL
jgi:hypothetical protein